MAEFTQLEPTNLRHQAQAAIRTRMNTGDVVAGEIYPVAYFASQLGVSSTPVREALFDWVHEGLLELVRNRGFRAVELSEKAHGFGAGASTDPRCCSTGPCGGR